MVEEEEEEKEECTPLRSPQEPCEQMIGQKKGGGVGDGGGDGNRVQ